MAMAWLTCLQVVIGDVSKRVRGHKLSQSILGSGGFGPQTMTAFRNHAIIRPWQTAWQTPGRHGQRPTRQANSAGRVSATTASAAERAAAAGTRRVRRGGAHERMRARVRPCNYARL